MNIIHEYNIYINMKYNIYYIIYYIHILLYIIMYYGYRLYWIGVGLLLKTLPFTDALPVHMYELIRP